MAEKTLAERLVDGVLHGSIIGLVGGGAIAKIAEGVNGWVGLTIVDPGFIANIIFGVGLGAGVLIGIARRRMDKAKKEAEKK